MKIKTIGTERVEVAFNGGEAHGTVVIEEGPYGPWIYMKSQDGKTTAVCVHFDLFNSPKIRVWGKSDEDEPLFETEAE